MELAKFTRSNKGFNYHYQEDLDTQHLTSPKLVPKALPRYRRKTWRNCLTLFFAAGLFTACILAQLAGWFQVVSGAYSETDDSSGSFLSSPLCQVDDVFAIDIVITKMSYRAVKIFDAAVNVFLGRACQVICGWISYQVFGMATLRILQEQAVPINYLYSTAFETYSIPAFWNQLRAFGHMKTARARTIAICLLISLIHLIATPTLLDLTTGYITSQDMYISTSNTSTGSLNPFTDDQMSAFRELYGHDHNLDWVCTSFANASYAGPNVTCPLNITIDGKAFGWADVLSEGGAWRVRTNDSDLSDPILCRPGEDYQYGISSGYLLIFSFMFLLWLLTIFGLWMDTMRFGDVWKTSRGWGPWRMMLDLGDHLSRTLGDDHSAYKNIELAKVIGKLPPVGYEVTISENAEYGNIRLSTTPGGYKNIRKPGVKFGGRSRVDDPSKAPD